MKTGCFSTFRPFFAKSLDAERVLRAVTVQVGTGDSVCGCDLKSAHDGALFLSLVTGESCGTCGELALVESVVGCDTSSLRAWRLVWTRARLFVCSKVLGERVGGFLSEGGGGFSRF